MKRSALTLCAALVVICLAGGVVEWSNRRAIASEIAEFESYNERDGKKEAEADIARGEFKWKVCGLSRNYDDDSARLKRLGIQVDQFAGCIVSEAMLRYRHAYNSTIYAHFEALVGEEITQEVLGSRPVDPTDERKG